jgi:hypothetical protein
MAQQKSEDRVVRAGLAVLLAGGSPVGPTPSGVRSQSAGGNASPGAESSENEDGMQVRLYGSGRWAPGWETAGMSACCLSSASCWCVLCSLRSDRAGQGAHREVGSEGFAELPGRSRVIGEPVGQIQAIPSLH